MTRRCSNILLLFILICFQSPVYAQTDSLTARILAADKVEILSHQDLHLRSNMEEMKMGLNGFWRRIVDSSGNLNECIVMEQLTLNKMDVDSLINVLSKNYYNGAPVSRASCFLPHETIVLYFNGRCSFVDICFGCRQFSASADIIFLPEFLTTEEQWDDLKSFFIAKGIKYKMALKD